MRRREGDLVDLHLHSTYSDGIFAPAEVVRQVKAANLVAMSLCDHDNVDGIDEALQAGAAEGVEVLTGVELSSQFETYRDIHLLGYAFDHRHPELCASLREFQDFRARRNEMILARVNEKLRAEGRAPLNLAAVQKRAGGTIGRPHIAMELIAQGYAANNDAAFCNYLVPCNVDKRFFALKEAIDLVHRAGGVAVLAHPVFITRQRPELERLLDALVLLGLDGVEAYNNGSSNDEIDFAITAARRRGLIVTGGSDVHGFEKGEVRIGSGRGNLRIPYGCVEEIRAARTRVSTG